LVLVSTVYAFRSYQIQEEEVVWFRRIKHIIKIRELLDFTILERDGLVGVFLSVLLLLMLGMVLFEAYAFLVLTVHGLTKTCRDAHPD